MRRASGFLVLLTGVLSFALLAAGITYLVVACEQLPGFLGPTPGDTSPRTALGIVGLVLGLATLSVAFLVDRRRPTP